MSAKFANLLAKSLFENEVAMKRMATATGLKLNDGKTKILPINLVEYERPFDPPGTPEEKKRVVEKWTMLGFPFKVVRTPDNLGPLGNGKKPKESVTGDPAAVAMIARLNESVRVMNTIRKVSNNLERRIGNACNLVYKSCYDIGLVYCYASNSYFKDIEICIKKVLKSAGLDWLTDSDILYRITLHMSPKLMAIKQIIQLGIKEIDPQKVKDDRYLIKHRLHDELRPFWSKFRFEFNNLPKPTRVYIVDNLNPLDKSSVEKIKARLKTHFRAIFDPAPFSKKKCSALIKKHKYSKSVVTKRKNTAKANKFEKDHNTPVAKRFRLSCPEVSSKLARTHTRAPPCPVRLRKTPLTFKPVELPTIDKNIMKTLYEPVSRLFEPTRHVYPRASAHFAPVNTTCTPVKKSLQKFQTYLNRQNSILSISKKRTVPESELNSFIYISDSFCERNMAPSKKKDDKNDKSNKNADNSPKSKAKTGKNSKKSNTKATTPVSLADFQTYSHGKAGNELAAAIYAMGKSASSCPEASEINPKHTQKTIIIMVHADTRKYIKKEFWDALKQNPFKQEFKLAMLTFNDKLPPVKSINIAADDKNIVGAILIPLFMKNLDYDDPDGALSEVNLPSRKRKRGFGQGTLANQPVASTAENDMDTAEGPRENTDFDAELPEKDATEIKLVMEHVHREFVVLASWVRNFEERFTKCSKFVMISQ